MFWVKIAFAIIATLLLVFLIIAPFFSFKDRDDDEGEAKCGRTGGKCTGDDPSCECRECKPFACGNCDHYREC